MDCGSRYGTSEISYEGKLFLSLFSGTRSDKEREVVYIYACVMIV